MKSRLFSLSTIILAMMIPGNFGFSQNLSGHGVVEDPSEPLRVLNSSRDAVDATSAPAAFVRPIPPAAVVPNPFGHSPGSALTHTQDSEEQGSI
jgi:hypothetical protein